MKRAVCFAHYDKGGLVQDYVLYCLSCLKEISDEIIFVSDGILASQEKDKLTNIVSLCIDKQHGEYDFGSYKRAFFALSDVEQYDEIIFVNDSCYGPLYSLPPIFEKMQQYDFWGITQHSDHQQHLQSYFLVFSRKVFTDPRFFEWVKGIKKEDSVRDVILNYEVTFTPYLAALGFSWDSYIHIDVKYDPLCYWKILVNAGCPLIKTRLFKEYYYAQEALIGWKHCLRKTGYPLELIDSHRSIYFWHYIFYKYIFQLKRTRSKKILVKLLKIPVWCSKMKK